MGLKCENSQVFQLDHFACERKQNFTMTGGGHDHGAPADDTSSVVAWGVGGGLVAFLLQVAGYGGIPQTAAVAGSTGIPGFVGGICCFCMAVVFGVNVGKAINDEPAHH